MASTGLLGFNPYQKGVNIDISSKPAAMAVQLIQHEAAKKEALDKYYKDYENTLNSAGMRNQDQDVFLNKLGEAKQYYLQNRDKILNPAKYGADAQAQYNSLLRGTQSTISQSKQLAASDKVDAEHFYQARQQGLDVPDGYIDAVERAHLPMNHPRFQALDPYQYNFTKPFDEAAFTRNLTAGLTPSENKQYTPSKDLGYQDVKTTFAFDKDAKDVVRHKGEIAYQTIPGVTNMTNKVIANGQVGNFQNQFTELYPGQDINNAKPAQIAAAIGLSLTPHGKTISSREADNSFAMFKKKADYSHELALQSIAANKAAQTSPAGPMANLFDAIGSGGALIAKDKRIENGLVTQNGQPYDGNIFIRKEDMPANVYNALGAAGVEKKLLNHEGFNAIVKNGRVQSISDPGIGTFDRQAMADAQLKWNTEPPKGRQPGFVEPSGDGGYSPTIEKGIAAFMQANKVNRATAIKLLGDRIPKK